MGIFDRIICEIKNFKNRNKIRIISPKETTYTGILDILLPNITYFDSGKMNLNGHKQIATNACILNFNNPFEKVMYNW